MMTSYQRSADRHSPPDAPAAGPSRIQHALCPTTTVLSVPHSPVSANGAHHPRWNTNATAAPPEHCSSDSFCKPAEQISPLLEYFGKQVFHADDRGLGAAVAKRRSHCPRCTSRQLQISARTCAGTEVKAKVNHSTDHATASHAIG
jgi:hypothetical protein